MRIRKAVLRGAFALLLALSLFLPGLAGTESAAFPEAETPEPTATAMPLSTLRSGSRGEAVLSLQLRLQELGYDPGTPDGIYGRGTRAAVSAFQRRNHLAEDGEAGPDTLRLIYSDEAVPVPTIEPTDTLSSDLPMLVNKAFPVDEYFVPANLVLLSDVLDPTLVKIKYDGTRAVDTVADALKEMLLAARADGVTKWQISAAYRSWQDQVNILNSKISSYLRSNKDWSRNRARKAALRTVAEPGASEHHLGLAIDINVPGASSFSGTRQCKWLHRHCWEYGFILRYPADKEDITGFAAEAWHIRYVGVEHALIMRDQELCLEEYLEKIADGSIDPPAETLVEDVLD